MLASLSENGFGAQGLVASPVKGGDGNREFLIWAKLGALPELGAHTVREVTHETH